MLRRYDADMGEAAEVGARRAALSESVLANALSVSEAGVESTIRSSKESASSLGLLQVLVLIGLVASVLIGLALSWFITRQITLPINVIIQGLTSAAEQVASASGQVASSSQQMAGGASQSASNLEEIGASLEEVTSMTRSNAENARRANDMAEKASSAATRGSSGMERMSDAIGKIQASASETAKIIKTIDEIAFQTNLLALNAAVEAARAGDAGKGFAVVAEEVRHLAMRSAEAAKTTSSLIEDSTRNAAGGVQVSQDVGNVLSEIVSNVQSVTKLVSDVAQASDQQAQGTQQVNTAMGQIDRITQANAANAEESASASEELSAQAVELNEYVDRLAALVHGAGHGTASAAPAPRAF